MTTPDEKGFTLVELIVGLTIMGIIMTALGAATFAGFRDAEASRERLAESHDAQEVGALFVGDVQSANTIYRQSDGITPCGGNNSNLIVEFDWKEQTSGGPVVKDAAYFWEAAGGEQRLIRRFCSAGAFQAQVIVAHALDSTVRPAIVCTSADTSLPDPCLSADTVAIPLTARSGYTYRLLGSRRAQPLGFHPSPPAGQSCNSTGNGQGQCKDYFLAGTTEADCPGSSAPLVLQNGRPLDQHPECQDSGAIHFSGGNPWVEVGTWKLPSSESAGKRLTVLGDQHSWLGLVSNADRGAGFDLMAEVLKISGSTTNVIVSGVNRCIGEVSGTTATSAKQVSVIFGSYTVPSFGTNDVLALRLSTRIGTDNSGAQCRVPGGSRTTASGLRVFFDGYIHGTGNGNGNNMNSRFGGKLE